VYAASDYAGAFKSTDRGGNWHRIIGGLPTSAVSAFAIDPAKPTTIYAGTTYRGVFKSLDSGDNWVSTTLTDAQVYVLAVDPTAPTTIYAGTYNRGVFKSTDGGGEWNTINDGLTNFTIQAFAVDVLRRPPSMPGHMEMACSRASTKGITGFRPT
jgi:photosystem II stability/assembly factor-like uncharacterized protein